MFNNNIAQHFKGYEIFINQLLEGIQRYQKNGISIPFGFVGLDKFEIIESVLSDKVPYQILKVNEEALSGRLVIGEDINEKEYITCLHGSYNDKYKPLTHKDILGSIMNLGISNETYGEIWVKGKDFYIICTKEISNYIINNLTQVSRYKVKLDIVNDIPNYEYEYEDIQIIVPNYRIDNIISEIKHCSRSKAQEFIKEGLCYLNFKIVNVCSVMLKYNDVLSLRSYGRYRIKEEITSTKSGNIIIKINKYI